MSNLIRSNFARELQLINETEEYTAYGIKNPALTKAVSSKKAQFDKYLQNLQRTGGSPFADMIKTLNSLSGKDLAIFVEGLGKYSSLEALQPNYLKEVNSSSFSNGLFNTQSKGIGPGELWLAWVVDGVRISGGGESFDVTHNEKGQYEVKSYADSHSPFRLGNAGAASQFVWLRKMRHVAEITEEIVAIPGLKDMHPEIFNAAATVNSRGEGKSAASDFSRGEVSKELISSVIDFIKIAKEQLANRSTGYDIIEVKSTSPGNPNMSFIIEPAKEADIKAGKFKIIKQVNMADVSNEEALYRMLAKNEYVRAGVESLVKDINDGLANVEKKYAKMKFVVFRKEAMNITSGLKKVQGTDIASQYGAGKEAIFGMSGALLRVREDA
jgi:hypothetical protein